MTNQLHIETVSIGNWCGGDQPGNQAERVQPGDQARSMPMLIDSTDAGIKTFHKTK